MLVEMHFNSACQFVMGLVRVKANTGSERALCDSATTLTQVRALFLLNKKRKNKPNIIQGDFSLGAVPLVKVGFADSR